jgi:hypothetical protein
MTIESGDPTTIVSEAGQILYDKEALDDSSQPMDSAGYPDFDICVSGSCRLKPKF